MSFRGQPENAAFAQRWPFFFVTEKVSSRLQAHNLTCCFVGSRIECVHDRIGRTVPFRKRQPAMRGYAKQCLGVAIVHQKMPKQIEHHIIT